MTELTEQAVADAVEALVDKASLLDVLTALELVCQERAAHLEANWQDRRSAQTWRRAAKAIYAAVSHNAVQAVS